MQKHSESLYNKTDMYMVASVRMQFYLHSIGAEVLVDQLMTNGLVKKNERKKNERQVVH